MHVNIMRWQTQEVTIYLSHVGDLDGFEGSQTEALGIEVTGGVFSAQESFSPHMYPLRVFNSHLSVLHPLCDAGSPNEVSWILDFRKQEGTQEMEAPLQEERDCRLG